MFKKLPVIFFIYFSLIVIQVYSMNQVEQDPIKPSLLTFSEWRDRCNILPHFKQVKFDYSHKALSFMEFKQTLTNFFKSRKRTGLLNKTNWLSDEIQEIYDLRTFPSLFSIFPYVQKLVVQPNDIVAFRGDLHGDIHSLIKYLEFLQNNNYLEDFKIKDPNFYMVFLGDYTDKGIYGVEVIYTIMRLKIENPKKVILIRGNHEDMELTEIYGFLDEFKAKFENEIKQLGLSIDDEFTKVHIAYDFLPVALFLGCGSAITYYLQCCHGGMELGYNPKNLLNNNKSLAFEWIKSLNKIEGSKIIEGYHTGITFYDVLFDFDQRRELNEIGFMWNDFIVSPFKNCVKASNRGGSSLVFGNAPTQLLLRSMSTQTNEVVGVFRAHQHENHWNLMMRSILDRLGTNPDSKGVGKIWRDKFSNIGNLWPGIVCTFCVAPDTTYGLETEIFEGFSNDYFGLLKTGRSFNDWNLEMFNNEIKPCYLPLQTLN